MPDAKHFDLMRGFKIGGVIEDTFGIPGRAHPGKDIDAIAQILIFSSVAVVAVWLHSLEASNVPWMWCMSS